VKMKLVFWHSLSPELSPKAAPGDRSKKEV
jgi:hypothetical protein